MDPNKQDWGVILKFAIGAQCPRTFIFYTLQEAQEIAAWLDVPCDILHISDFGAHEQEQHKNNPQP